MLSPVALTATSPTDRACLCPLPRSTAAWLILERILFGAANMPDSRHESGASRVRPILVALILILGAYWVGARYGPHQVKEVEARHLAAPAPELPAAPVGV